MPANKKKKTQTNKFKKKKKDRDNNVCVEENYALESRKFSKVPSFVFLYEICISCNGPFLATCSCISSIKPRTLLFSTGE